jgi:hypothetical protein
VDNSKRRLRTPAAADYLGVSASTMAKQRMIGNGPPYLKLGKIIVYDTDDLDQYAAAHRRHSTSEPGPTRPAAAKNPKLVPAPSQSAHRGSRVRR